MLITDSLKRRFWEKVRKTDSCWLWTGYRLGDGRGRINTGGANGPIRYASNVSWEIHFGPIPEGKEVLHKCDNYSCVNPDHLFLGTQTDNMRDMGWKRRGASTKLTREQVIEIRKLHEEGRSYAEIGRLFKITTSHARRTALEMVNREFENG